MNVLLAQIFQRLYIAADIHLPVCSPCFNGVMDIDALDPGNMEPGALHLLFQRPDPLPAPHFSRLRIVKRRDDPVTPGIWRISFKVTVIKPCPIPPQSSCFQSHTTRF